MNNKTTFTVSKSRQKNIRDFYKQMPKLPIHEWPKEMRLNKSVYDARYCPQREGYSFFVNPHKQLQTFINKFGEYSYVKNITNECYGYSQISEYGYLSSNFMVKKYWMDGLIWVVECENAKLMFTTYDDGIMLHGINVNPEYRDKGIGSKIMNDLYDISEEMNIELYLQPYPDDNFEGGANEEKQLVTRLQKYYTRLGFGPTSKNPMIWSNMELA